MCESLPEATAQDLEPDWVYEVVGFDGSTGDVASRVELHVPGRHIYEAVDAQVTQVVNGYWLEVFEYTSGDWNARDDSGDWMARVDPRTGKITKFENWVLLGSGLGYVWAEPRTGPVNKLLRIDASTLKTATIPFAYEDASVACGSLWGIGARAITRLDPATGGAIQTIETAGRLSQLMDTPDGCWAQEDVALADLPTGEAGPSPPASPSASGREYVTRFVRIGESGLDAYTPPIWDETLSGTIERSGGTYWSSWCAQEEYGYCNWWAYQQLNPWTWAGMGPVWGSYQIVSVFVAGGYFWTASTCGYYFRTEAALATPPAQPTSTPSISPSPTASPSPSPAPSLSPFE